VRLAIALDIFKGYLPVALARQAGLEGWELIPVCLAPILGHATTPFLKFRGGKALGPAGGTWAAPIGLWVFWIFTSSSLLALVLIKNHAWSAWILVSSLNFWVVFVDGSIWMVVLAILTLSLIIAFANHLFVRRPENPDPSVASPFVSILVPARNEAENINACIASLLAQDYPYFEVIVLDDASEDGTRPILECLRTGSEKLRIIDAPPCHRAGSGSIGPAANFRALPGESFSYLPMPTQDISPKCSLEPLPPSWQKK
jgi:hypothetical protein